MGYSISAVLLTSGVLILLLIPAAMTQAPKSLLAIGGSTILMGLLMAFWTWVRSGPKNRTPNPQEMAPFLDVESGRVVHIPVSELRPGSVQVQIKGSGQIVWALAEQLGPDDVKHVEFDELRRDQIRHIQALVAEQYPLSLEDWEDGFRRDAHPDQEIALWSHVAQVYAEFTHNELNADRRREIFQCLVACMTTGPEAVWKVLRPNRLSREEADRIVRQYFRRHASK